LGICIELVWAVIYLAIDDGGYDRHFHFGFSRVVASDNQNHFVVCDE
jgi:hypothetical protein